MRKEQITFLEFVEKLIRVSGLNQKELAEKIGVQEQTITNWRNNPPQKVSTNTIHKLEAALRDNDWGISLGNVSHSKIEIIHTRDVENSSIKSGDSDKVQELLNQTLAKLYAAERENKELKDKLDMKPK